jgi:hypothetical protein
MVKVENSKENSDKCLCPKCPTWKSNDCPAQMRERLYCAKGKTACDLADKGCLCGMCPVFEQYKLRIGYFCFNGEAK